jgi:hypothetical protein
MVVKAARSATVTLRLHRLALDAGSEATVGCPCCGGPLDLHQPVAAYPWRLIGTCRPCATWFLIEGAPEGPGVVLVDLLGPGAIGGARDVPLAQ